ncbi:hypothetical protein F7725_009244 [Dissostichus mawsoni]|uniref:Thioredoxin domain containing 16 n=1 Tax=Dissostichus mawsoni TaxID=36200 RepID=A0A7J5Z6M4_DISMA|nr:hypothetical protein F7725_009244 [Dissostichus mawsoni]
MFSMMWMCVAVFLLWLRSGGCTEKANTSELIEYTAADFHEKLHSGKMMFIYFEHQVSPTISLFLLELEKSADALQDYGVLVGKVNCDKKLVQAYCTKERERHTAFLFRGGKEFLGFDLDTVFDVKYVHTDTDLLAMEKAARGKKDIVLGYVRSLGTQEHRSMMETAYVYGSKYQFILITGGPVLKHLGVDESSPSSQVWFLHCRVHSKLPLSYERCPLTRMRKPLSTLSLHSFLQLMEAPLVSEVYDDPSSVQPPQFPYQQTPQVFLFSRPATKQQDLDTANALAWRLRGLALLLLVHRQSPAVKTPDEYNAAYRLPEKSSEVKYLTLNDHDEVLELFTNQEKEEEDEEEDEGWLEDEEVDSHFDCCVRLRKPSNLPDMDSITQLTSDNFHTAVSQSSLTVALFYLKWDAVSMAFLSSFIEVAERLEDADECSGLWRVDRPLRCSKLPPIPFQPITAFPCVLLLRPKEPAQLYRGMLGSEALHRFILLSIQASPALLSTKEEVTSFLQEVPHPELAGYHPDRVMGLFKTQLHTVNHVMLLCPAGVSLFTEAAKSLRGEMLIGLLTNGLAEKCVGVSILETHTPPSTLPVSTSSEELLTHIHSALLHPLPELTVENLPSFLSLGKALLLLFVGEEEDEIGRRQNQALVEEMRGVVEVGGGRMEQYLACWIHLYGPYTSWYVRPGVIPWLHAPLPALVLTHLPSGDEIYQFPPNMPIVASSVLQWLQRIQGGAVSAAGMLGEDSWPPAVEFLDFLKIMDVQEPDSAQQQTPEEEEEEEDSKEEDVNVDDSSSPSDTFHNNPHSEL